MTRRYILCFFILLEMISWGQQTEFNQLLKKKDSKEKIDQLTAKSEEYWLTGDYTNAMIFAKEAQRISEHLHLKKEEAYALNNIGIIQDYQGNYSNALKNYFKALNLQKSIHDESGMAYTYNNIGLIYSNQHEYQKALDNYNIVLKIRKKSNDLSGLASTYNNIGIIHMYKRDFNKALENYLKSAEIDSLLKNTSGISDSYSNIGLVYMDLYDFANANLYFQKALATRLEMHDKRGIANSYNNIATLLIKQNKNREAEDFLLKGLALSKEMGAKILIEYSYYELSVIAEKEKRFEDAFVYQQLYYTYRDSIKNEIETKKQTEAEMQYQFDQQRNKAKLKKQREDLINKQAQQRLNILIVGLSFIIVLVLIFAYYLNKRRKNELSQKLVIEEQKLIVETKNREILDSITYAKRIQSAILPTDRLIKEYLSDSFVLYKPKDIVAGDFYWIEPTRENILFAVADCTGHGVPGAMVSVVCHNALNRSVREYQLTEPGPILNKCRELILEEFRKSEDNVHDGMDISLCSLNLETNKLKWSGANSPLWIKKSKENELMEFKASKQPIGYFDDPKPFETIEIQLEKDDRIYLFSDGFIDQFGGAFGKKIKTKGLKELILNQAHQEMQDQRKNLDAFFENWKNEQEQVDDVCMIGLRI